MKKSLIALAVLAASGASFAQSVTLYGIADIYGGVVKNKNYTVANQIKKEIENGTQTVIDSGGFNTSRWGIKGSEDLGGGLTANFKLEQGFKLDSGASGNSTGTAGPQTFDRQSWVGLSGDFGAVQIGKSWSAFDDVIGASNAIFDANLAPIYAVFQSANYNDRPQNGLRYESPTVAGFAGVVTYALGEDKTSGKSANDIYAFNVTYGEGPVAVQLGYQVEESNAPGESNLKYSVLGGSYDFGVAVAKLIFAHVSNVGNAPGEQAREYQIGVDVPVNDALTLSASYARSEDSLPAGAYEPTRKGYAVGATYAMSKRTFLYSVLSYSEESQQANPDSKTTTASLGIQHRF